jgi:hypothetical protein
MVPALSCAAVAAGADGLLIEVHPCPTEAWCDLRSEVCRSRDVSTPPHIVVDGLSAAKGPFGKAISIAASGNTTASIRLHNDGGSQADTTVMVGTPSCLHAITLFGDDIGPLDPGEAFEDDILFDPDPGCATPAAHRRRIAAKRPFAASFDITLRRDRVSHGHARPGRG